MTTKGKDCLNYICTILIGIIYSIYTVDTHLSDIILFFLKIL